MLPKGHWSYSSWELADQCPLRYKLRYIDRLPEPPNPAAARGTEIHAMGEQYLLGRIKGIPKYFKDFSSELRTLKKLKAEPECWANVTREWKPTEFDGKWIVSKQDVRIRESKLSAIIDFKSGRIYADKHYLQGSLYAAIEFAHRPDVEKVVVEMWYVDQNDTRSWEYTRDELGRVQLKWTARGEALEKMNDYPPKPGPLCKWCNFSSKNGGPCSAA